MSLPFSVFTNQKAQGAVAHGHDQTAKNNQKTGNIQPFTTGRTHHVEIRSAVENIKNHALFYNQSGVAAILLGEGYIARLHDLETQNIAEKAIPAIIKNKIAR